MNQRLRNINGYKVRSTQCSRLDVIEEADQQLGARRVHALECETLGVGEVFQIRAVPCEVGDKHAFRRYIGKSPQLMGENAQHARLRHVRKSIGEGNKKSWTEFMSLIFLSIQSICYKLICA
jgi:hypothetical protein